MSDFKSIFEDNFNYNWDIFQNNLENFSKEVFYINKNLLEESITLDDFSCEKDTYFTLFFYIENNAFKTKNEGISKYFLVKKCLSLSYLDIFVNFFKLNPYEIEKKFESTFMQKKNYSDIFSIFWGEQDIFDFDFSNIKSINLVFISKNYNVNFFDFSLYFEFFLINYSFYNFQIRGNILENYDKKIIFELTKSIFPYKNFRIVNIAGIFMELINYTLVKQNSPFYEILPTILQKYKEEFIVKEIYKDIFKIFKRKKNLFIRLKYAEIYLQNFTLDFLINKHLNIKNEEFMLLTDDLYKIEKKSYESLLYFFSQDEYKQLLHKKFLIIRNYQNNIFFELNDFENNPENRSKVLETIINFENLLIKKYIYNEILNLYFKYQKLKFI